MVASLLLGLMGLPAGDQTVRGGWRSREGKNSTLRERELWNSVLLLISWVMFENLLNFFDPPFHN